MCQYFNFLPSFLGTFAKSRKATTNFVCLSVRIEQLGSQWPDFHEIGYLSIFRKSVVKIRVSLNLTRITSTLHEDKYTILIISRSVLLRMRNVSNKRCRENRNTFYVR